MRCDLVQDALVPPGQRARVRTTPPGLSGTRTGGRRRMGSALIRRYVTTSELGLRLISKADPRELCPREPASEARLSFLEPRHFIKLFAACSANLRRRLEHLFPAVWTHSKEGTQPPPARGSGTTWQREGVASVPHGIPQLSWGRPQTRTVSSSLPCLRSVQAALWAPTGSPASQPCLVADWLTTLFGTR